MIGELRLSMEQAGRLTLNEILIMHLAEQRRREDQLSNTRLVMWEIRTKHLRKGKRITPKDIFSLPSEKQAVTILTREEYRKLQQMWGN